MRRVFNVHTESHLAVLKHSVERIYNACITHFCSRENKLNRGKINYEISFYFSTIGENFFQFFLFGLKPQQKALVISLDNARNFVKANVESVWPPY